MLLAILIINILILIELVSGGRRSGAADRRLWAALGQTLDEMKADIEEIKDQTDKTEVDYQNDGTSYTL